LTVGESLKQKRVMQKLSDSAVDALDFLELISAVYGQICANRTDRRPSRKNWRVERQTRISPHNRSPEILLERAVAQLGERGVLGDWYNQVPVASGLVNAHADKRAAVDLMRYEEHAAVLVELKWASDTPAFAAFEILRYGLTFLFAFVHQHNLGYDAKPLLGVRSTSLWVLAPHNFYADYDLTWLETGLNEGLGAFAKVRTDGCLSMDFAFKVFPNDFEVPFESGADVLKIAEGDTSGGRAVTSAIRDIAPLQGAVLHRIGVSDVPSRTRHQEPRPAEAHGVARTRSEGALRSSGVDCQHP
jgi:hypothetical protein